MTASRTDNNRSRFALMITGGFVIMLGAMVLIGWHAHIPLLVQVRPTYVPMWYNTALCFIISGTGLLAIACGRLRSGSAVGALTMVIGMVTLVHILDSLNGRSHLQQLPRGNKHG